MCGEGWDGGDICERTAIHHVALKLRARDTVDTLLRPRGHATRSRPDVHSAVKLGSVLCARSDDFNAQLDFHCFSFVILCFTWR